MNASIAYNIGVKGLCYAGIAGLLSDGQEKKVSAYAAGMCSVAEDVFLFTASSVMEESLLNNTIVSIALGTLGALAGAAVANLAGYKLGADDFIILAGLRFAQTRL